MQQLYPNTQIFYAVKANAEIPILQALHTYNRESIYMCCQRGHIPTAMRVRGLMASPP